MTRNRATDPGAPSPVGPDPAGPGALFRGVDTATLAGAFVHRLRAAGLEVGPVAANRLALALRLCPPTDVETLYWTARSTTVCDRADHPIFDRVFAAVFGGIGLPVAPWERDQARATIRTEGVVMRRSVPTDGLAALAARVSSSRPEVVDDDRFDDEADADDRSMVAELLPAELEAVADHPFDQLDAEQLDRIGRWLAQVGPDLPQRRTRRRVGSRHGAIDLRRTLARSRSTGEVMTLARRRQRLETRPVLMLADVSGSMESFSRIHLHLLRAFATSGAGGRYEAFTFALHLHRITAALTHRDADEVIDRLCDEVGDRFGGTRIASCLGQLIASPRWSHMVRGATVVIASDGWDTDPPELLARRMERLSRMAHRIVWVNPRAAGPAWEPAVGGMAAALPHVDELCSGHSLRAMLRVVDAIAGRS